VHVQWERVGDGEGAGVKLIWREEGGPLVKQPDFMGFGVSMIERTARNNGWKADVCFEPEGLRTAVVFPVVPTGTSQSGDDFKRNLD
jgi:two-component sensor histidine kinase